MEELLYYSTIVIATPPSIDQPQMPYGDLMIGIFGLAILISLFSRL